jgi:hypothetical protein
VGSQRLTAWAMAVPMATVLIHNIGNIRIWSLNYFENRRTCGKFFFSVNCVGWLVLPQNFVRNVFRWDKYLASYAQDTSRRNTYSSSRDVSDIDV